MALGVSVSFDCCPARLEPFSFDKTWPHPKVTPMMPTVPAAEAPPAAVPAFLPPPTLCPAHVFEAEGALDMLEAFGSLNGPAHYRLPANERKITLKKQEAPVAFPARTKPAKGL